MGVLGLHLPKAVDNVFAAAGHGLNPFDSTGWTSAPTAQQAAQQSIANANQQIQTQRPAYGVLAQPQNTNLFAQSQSTGNSFNPVTAGAGALYGYAKSIPAGIVNTVQAPYSLGRLGVANLFGNQVAANNARQAFGSDAQNNLFSADVPFLRSVASAALTPATNYYSNQEQQRALNELAPIYGQNSAEVQAGRIKQGFLTDQLANAGLSQNDSVARTALKVGAQAGQFGLNNLFLADQGNSLADKLTGKAVKVTKQSLAKRTAASGGQMAAVNALGTAQQDDPTLGEYVKSGLAGFGTGALLSAGTELGGKALAEATKKLRPPSSLNPGEVADLNAFSQDARSGRIMDNDVYAKGVAAAAKAGIDYRDPKAIGDLVLAHQTYDVKKQQVIDSLQNARQKADEFAQKHGLGLSTLPVDDTGKPVTVSGKGTQVPGLPEGYIMDKMGSVFDPKGKELTLGEVQTLHQRGTGQGYTIDYENARNAHDTATMAKIAAEHPDDVRVHLTPLAQEFNAKDYVKERTAAQKAAADAKLPTATSKKTLLKAKSVDALAPIEDPVVAAAGRKGELNLRNQLDRSLRSGTIAGQYAKDNGLHDIIQKVPDTKAFDQYVIAKHAQDLEANGIKTGRNLGKDQQLVDALAPQYEKHAQDLKAYNQGLLDKATEYGLVSKDTADYLKQKYPNYVPMERIFGEGELNNTKGTGTGPASISTQTVVQRIKGSGREIASPLQSIAAKTHDVIAQGERSLAAKELISAGSKLEGNPMGIKALRTADDVNARIDLYSQAKELKPAQAQLQKLLSTRSRWGRELQSELNKLNQKGLDVSLAKAETPTEAPILSGQRDVLKGVVRVTNPLRSTPTLSGTVETRQFSRPLTALETKKMVNNLVNLPSSELENIKSKIVTRENKLGPIMDEVSSLRAAVEGVKNNRTALFDEARLHADAEARGKSTISTFNKGVKEIYEVNPEVAAAAKSLNKQQLGFVGKILAAPTRVLRLGATGANAAFALANVAKDTASAFINSEHPLRSSVANPKVFLASMDAALHHGGSNYAELVREGAGGTSFDIARNSAEKSVKQIRAERNAGTKALYTVTHPGQLLRVVEDTIGRSEEFGRAQQYFGNKEAALKAGETPAQARVYGADAARNNTVNFARAGEYGRVLNSVLPYFNAGIQGSRTLIRNLKERPAQTATKIALTAFVPVAAATAWNLNDPERKKAYDNISEYEKQNNIIIVPPHPKQDSQGRWNVIKIPVSQEIANLNNVVRNGVEARAGDKSFNFPELAGNLAGTVTSLNTQNPRQLLGQVLPQAVKPFVESATNQNLFTGQQLVPDAIKNLNPQDQVGANTSGTARVIGKLTGQSPLKVDNTIRTTTGGLGQNLVHVSDTALNKAGVIPSDQVKGKSFGESVSNRFNSAQGTTAGTDYFKTIQQTAKDAHLAGRDYNALQTVLSKEIDTNGNTIPMDDKTAYDNAGLLAHNPAVAAVKSQAATALAAKSGKPLDPLYNLTPEQQNVFYKLQSTPKAGGDWNDIFNKNKDWLIPFDNQRSQFYRDNPVAPGNTPSNKIPYPSIDASTTDLTNQYFSIKDPKQASAFIQQHPEISDAFKQKAEYNNQVRQATGYDPLVVHPDASPYVQAQLNAKRYNDPQVQQYLNDSALFNINKGGSLAAIAGNAPSQAELKGINSIGNYGLVKNPDGSLAVAGSPQVGTSAVKVGGFSGSGNSGGGSRGASGKLNAAKYLHGISVRGAGGTRSARRTRTSLPRVRVSRGLAHRTPNSGNIKTSTKKVRVA